MRLHVRSRDNREELLRLEIVGTDILEQSVDARLAPFLDDCLTHGLVEWVGPEESKRMHITMLGHPEFVKRIADYLARQSKFIIRLDTP